MLLGAPVATSASHDLAPSGVLRVLELLERAENGVFTSCNSAAQALERVKQLLAHVPAPLNTEFAGCVHLAERAPAQWQLCSCKVVYSAIVASMAQQSQTAEQAQSMSNAANSSSECIRAWRADAATPAIAAMAP